MKSFAGRFVSWFLFDICLALIPCGIFAALVSASLVDGKTVPYGWLTVCLAFLLHFGVLATGLYVTSFVAALLLGVLGISAGEPG